ncbi:MAG TPA: AAA family ATPase [Pirellulales bacterium]|nr:AAA family ATPase [Pirellulales bacterium]
MVQQKSSQEPDYQTLALQLGKMFKPSSPIKKDDLFQGRTTQIREVVDAINQPGKHVVLYGEAGVGKTSLGQVLKTRLKAIEDTPIIAPLINCDSSDDFSSLWREMFVQINEEYADIVSTGDGESPNEPDDASDNEFSDLDVLDSDNPVTPRDVRKRLEPLSRNGIVYVILDEFDKVSNPDVRRMMADTIKLFSDREVLVTIILIGVAENVTGLIDDHRSIERCLAQVHLPRMPFKELITIVQKGLSEVSMTIKEDALEEIAGLSRGLPHYTHLLALNAGRNALDEQKLAVSKHNVSAALKAAIGQTDESIRHKYDEATYSTKKNTLHKQVLLACALADCDEFGYFQPNDVVEPLSLIEKREFTTDRFMSHLKRFCDIKVLSRMGGEYRWRYHFDNPLLQPYVIMKGIEEGLVKREQLNFSDQKYPLFVKRRSTV